MGHRMVILGLYFSFIDVITSFSHGLNLKFTAVMMIIPQKFCSRQDVNSDVLIQKQGGGWEVSSGGIAKLKC